MAGGGAVEIVAAASLAVGLTPFGVKAGDTLGINAPTFYLFAVPVGFVVGF